MRLRKKKSVLDQAREQAGAVLDSVRESVHDLVEDYDEHLRPQVEAAAATARDEARARLAEARTKAGPALADARAKAGPALADARAKAAPYVAQGAAYAQDRAGELSVKARELSERGTAALSDATGGRTPVLEPRKKRSKLKTGFLVVSAAAVAGLVAKKLQGGGTDPWQAAPPPGRPVGAVPTTPPPGAVSPSAPMAGGQHLARPEDDAAGAAPGEALSDEADEPVVPTTPDSPAEVIEINDPDR